MDAPQQAARSGGGAVTVTVLLKVAKMMLDVLKLLYQVVQLVYGGEMAAARGESGAEMGCKSRRGTEGGEEVIIEVLENKASLRERIAASTRRVNRAPSFSSSRSGTNAIQRT